MSGDKPINRTTLDRAMIPPELYMESHRKPVVKTYHMRNGASYRVQATAIYQGGALEFSMVELQFDGDWTLDERILERIMDFAANEVMHAGMQL